MKKILTNEISGIVVRQKGEANCREESADICRRAVIGNLPVAEQ